MRSRLLAVAAGLSCLVVAPRAAAPPKLAVILVVDQMRADYVDRFQNDWSAGLKRLVTKGAWFRRAAYPYLETLTCAGHATIATGAYPVSHGIFQNTWFDRDSNRLILCTQDAAASSVSYGRALRGNDGPANLRIPTLADEMRRQRESHVVSLSLKARSAIMLAGQGGNAVTWLSETLDGWETSTRFATTPVPEVAKYVAANPIEVDLGKAWTLSLPADRYKDKDDGLGEAPPQGWTSSFPHVLSGQQSGKADAAYYGQWERSPFADAYLGRMAAGLVESMELGRHETTDILAVSFSSPDLVGHGFGPKSREIQDMYARLDHTIGLLLDQLDRLVGEDQYVVALSADHGVTPIPEQAVAEGRDAGRLNGNAVAVAVEQIAQKALGPAQAVWRIVGSDLYFRPGVFDKLAAHPTALSEILKAIEARPGVLRAFHAGELAKGTTSKDSLLRAAALSWVEGRSGDIIIAAKPGWMGGANGTTHGSASADDQRVPIILYGSGIRAGRYNDAATPADIVGVSLPQAQGKALTVALTPPSGSAANR
jgi:hypothetical protein